MYFWALKWISSTEIYWSWGLISIMSNNHLVSLIFPIIWPSYLSSRVTIPFLPSIKYMKPWQVSSDFPSISDKNSTFRVHYGFTDWYWYMIVLMTQASAEESRLPGAAVDDLKRSIIFDKSWNPSSLSNTYSLFLRLAPEMSWSDTWRGVTLKVHAFLVPV